MSKMKNIVVDAEESGFSKQKTGVYYYSKKYKVGECDATIGIRQDGHISWRVSGVGLITMGSARSIEIAERRITQTVTERMGRVK